MIPVERIEGAIFEVRGQKVMLDVDLADLRVVTGALVRAVMRNLDRFPADFQFRLTPGEFDSLRCQIGISKGAGRSPDISLCFHRAWRSYGGEHPQDQTGRRGQRVCCPSFHTQRRLLAGQRELALKLAELESKLTVHDENFKAVFDAIRKHHAEARALPEAPRQIGFHVSDRPAKHAAGPGPKKT